MRISVAIRSSTPLSQPGTTPNAGTEWSDTPDTTVQTDDNLVSASDGDLIFVRFRDTNDYVSAPVDTGVVAGAG
jgi:hypothetical protein